MTYLIILLGGLNGRVACELDRIGWQCANRTCARGEPCSRPIRTKLPSFAERGKGFIEKIFKSVHPRDKNVVWKRSG